MKFSIKKILAFILLIFILTTFFSGTVFAMQETSTAVVIEASGLKGVSPTYQTVKLKITSGNFKGRIFTIKNQTAGNYAYDMVVKKGDRVSVYIKEQNGNINVFIIDFYHQNYILYLTLFFLVLLILVGKGKGIKAILTLSFTIFIIIKIILPAILLGYNSILVTIIFSTVIIVVSMLIIAGFNNKSIAAILGTLGGVLLAGFIAYFVEKKMGLTGFSSDEVAELIMNMPQQIDIKNLIFPGIILGALGAVMDVSISIASAEDEIYKANNNLSTKELFLAGMNVGRDVMGTMANTLILAYAGSSMALLFLFVVYQSSVQDIVNMDIVANEIVRSLAESSGLVASIPLTAILSSILITREKKQS